MTEDVTVMIPTLDEAATIGDVVEGFVERGYEHVLVIDGGSSDDTQEIAREAGARVIEQSGTGKGDAMMQGFAQIDTEYVLVLDGDGTYLPKDAEALLEPLRSGEAEHVVGNRFADIQSGAMPRLNQVGNKLINWAYRTIHQREHYDILSGYRAMTVDSLDRMNLSAEGFGIETEMCVECVRHGIDSMEVPITYETRPAGSETNLHPIKDGGTIIVTLYRLAKTNNPLFYFGSFGTVALLTGLAIASYVGYDWFVNRVPHEVLAVVAAAGILVGIQLIMFGFLSDMIVALHRDQRRRIERVERRFDDED
ncbi:glycosyl transferase family 2 [Salinarchaeum sp. Harcht-Bsk1]|uniref:S-layer glycoprotein N-glycosyltransferase AglJ n=1 Tax=Salinarchaeum sp. Harcht-Bsk1 TaxID=1333523 RepID=UPI0003422867|nr:S-layer glycoprotein N-glycosyltransferase AglJ [Salinarchaeum sp. Harcht-Bsk1]AGN01014.1 glycosyl transferase family 2 [Salinarchaeum sp. Harcht-Bsk1]